MLHFKILGWMWLIFGSIFLILTACAMLAPSDNIDQDVVISAWAWWENLIFGILEVAFFCAAVVVGLALLGRWHWGQHSLSVLGAFLLAIWMLFVLSPMYPPVSFGVKILILSPMLVLALYSLIAALLTKSQESLSPKWKTCIGAGSFLGMLFVVVFHAIAFHNLPPTLEEQAKLDAAHLEAYSHISFDSIRVASEAFTKDRKKRGLPVPLVVSFNELASQGYLAQSQAALFSDAEATVSPKASESGSNTVWIRIRWKYGYEISVPYVKPEQKR